MRKAGLDESPVGIQIAGRNINNLRYADDTTPMAESEEELKSLLMWVKEESAKVGLKLNIKKTKIMASSPFTSWQIDGEEMEVVTDFIFLGSKITADRDCSQEIKRRLLLGREAMANLDSILKSRDITLPTKVRIVKAMLYELFPWLMRRLPGPHQKAISCLEFIHSFGRKEIRNHKEKKKLDDLPDFIDYYLSEIDRKKGDPATSLDEDNLVQVIYDLFTAGTDTVVSTLQWALLFMVVYPDVQENIQKEIDAVLTPSQCIFYEDQKKMPYTNAVIHEILRFNFVLLVGSFRRCTKDTTILGFPIKKGTIVILDIASALYDPKKWETPHQFNPNHFLDKDGNFQNNDAFIPFSVGQRLCLGENLARKELFLFITNVLQAFTLQMPEGVTELSTTPAKGFSVQPYPYKICALPRNLVA
ncbi:Cytochrome P450 2J2 [Varanus komodoensis]|nr:Cytochrome P450 2J2 [Varanus komodoensis]